MRDVLLERHVNFSQADLPVKAHEALGGSVLHEQESEIFLYDLFVLDSGKCEENFLGAFDLAEGRPRIERLREVVVGEVAVLLELAETLRDVP